MFKKNEVKKPKVRYRDLSVSNLEQKNEILKAVDRVLTHGQFMLGPEVETLEKKIAKYCNTKYCVGLSSGTDALNLALRSYNIGPGDEVITTPLSWVATFNSIQYCGATPVAVDICEDLNINADLIENAITEKTKALMPVHFTGRLCDMEKISQIANKHNLLVIEDAAQAFGARINGVYAGAFGDAGCFSFNAMKVLPGYGEMGAVLTNDKDIYDQLISLRYLGFDTKGEICFYPSLNNKIDTLLASMMLTSFKYFDENFNTRIKISNYYSDNLSDYVVCPILNNDKDVHCTFFDYTIIAEDRDNLKHFLEGKGIETKIKHSVLMNNQPAYDYLPKFDLLLF